MPFFANLNFFFSREVEDKGWWKGEVDGRWVAQIINKLENKKNYKLLTDIF